ncbi:molybdopterin molybdotransferase MoeA [Microbacteriaceae bacterium VKM Ac-2855]|nr:molybdopterin molybdotransferase MoeA [Microbacteriaceae bacterium VKM Ac-2855]
MTSIELYAARIAALLSFLTDSPLRSETLPLTAEAMSADPGRYDRRVLARSVTAGIDLPRFDNSQMDGYAVSSADLAEVPRRLSVAAPVPAGDAAPQHDPGTATPIMTGSPLPAGADAVVPIERADPPRFGVDSVTFSASVAAGTFVRSTGSDQRAGELLLPVGTTLHAAHYGLLASVGLTEAEVVSQLRVLVVPTGNEIRPAGTELTAAQIFDANGPLLAEALREIGARATVVPCTSDTAEDLLAILRRYAPAVDLVVTIGGVSAGAYEVVRDALEPLGAVFGHVDMQPGGPQGHGLVTVDEGTSHVPIVSLPGNPVSALVSFEVFLRPLLRSLAGRVPAERPRLRGRLTESLDSPAHLHQIRRGLLDDEGLVRPIGGPSSHLLSSYARSNVLIHVPIGTGRLAAGDTVELWRIDD